MANPLARDPHGAPRVTSLAASNVSGERVTQDDALLLIYLVCFALVLALLPLDHTTDWVEIAPALILQVLVGILLWTGPRLSSKPRRMAGTVGVLAYLVSVALLRDGGGSTAGFGPLVLLPVTWTTLRGRRTDFAVAVIGLAVVYLVPELLIGPPRYPTGSWRAGLLFVVIATVLGLAKLRDVERVNQLVDELDLLARTDELTRLPNRRAWKECLDRELATARRSGQALAIAVIDLDSFKDYNDQHGHVAGDQLLARATAAWRRVLRPVDVLARWGGDEFGLLMPGCDVSQGQAAIARMRAACPAAPISAGIAAWDGRSTADAMVDTADERLYRVKHARRSDSGSMVQEDGWREAVPAEISC